MSHDGDGDSDSPANDGDGEALQEGSPTPAQALKGDSPLLDQEKSGIDPTSSPAKTGVISTFSEVVSNVVPLPVEETGFVIKDGIAELAIPVELMEERNPLWKCFIAGYFMNDAPHIGSIHATVNRIWALQGKNNRIDVQFIGKTTVLFRIEDAGVRSRVLKRKFWHIGDFPLMVELEGFPDKEVAEKSGTEMVAKLLEELQSVIVRENLLNVSVNQPQSSREKVAQGPAISGDSLDHSPPIVASNDSGCISPNRFLLLQDVREEGEIDEEHVEDHVDELDNLVEEVGAAKYLISKPSVVATKQTSSQRSRG
ncbi:hypothetical protein YC2023_077613 [Brassica napus]